MNKYDSCITEHPFSREEARRALPPCVDCNTTTQGRSYCPLCDYGPVCQRCAEREGAFCCNDGIPYRTAKAPSRVSREVQEEIEISIESHQNSDTGEPYIEVRAHKEHHIFKISWTASVTFPAVLSEIDRKTIINAICEVIGRVR